MRNLRTLSPLSNEQLQILAPSIFATKPHGEVSDKYSFIPTIDVVERMRTEGWFPVSVQESGVRDDSKSGFQKHILKFRQADGMNSPLTVGDSIIEAVLVNSHDRSSAYQLFAGVFRLACSNGLVVSDGSFGRVSTKHIGANTADQVLEASYRIIEDAPKITASIRAMESVRLTPAEQMLFAETCLSLKYDAEKNPSPIEAKDLLTTRRFEDQGNTLWQTFNKVQENLVKGGIRGQTQTGRRMKTKGVNSISENVKLNRALWTMAEQMAALKTASAS